MCAGVLSTSVPSMSNSAAFFIVGSFSRDRLAAESVPVFSCGKDSARRAQCQISGRRKSPRTSAGSEFELHAQIDRETLHLLSGRRVPGGSAARCSRRAAGGRCSPRRSPPRGRASRPRTCLRGRGAVGRFRPASRRFLSTACPRPLADQHLAPFEFFDERQAPQQDAVEVVLPKPRHPGIGGEFVKIHARKGVGIVEIGAVALVEFEQRVGDRADDVAAPHGDRRVADGGSSGR